MESETFDRIVELVREGSYKISAHALGELIEDDLTADDVVNNIGDVELLEDYPDFRRVVASCSCRYAKAMCRYTLSGAYRKATTRRRC